MNFLENRLDFFTPSRVGELAVIDSVILLANIVNTVHVINALQIPFLTKIFILMRKLSFSHFFALYLVLFSGNLAMPTAGQFLAAVAEVARWELGVVKVRT